MNISHFMFETPVFALLFSLAAATGAFLRHICNTALKKRTGDFFPWGIFCVNTLGCFGFGCVFALTEHTTLFHENIKSILLTAFLGSFTTFSTYIFDGNIFLKKSQYFKFTYYILGQILLGLGLFWLAMKIF